MSVKEKAHDMLDAVNSFANGLRGKVRATIGHVSSCLLDTVLFFYVEAEN
jgi:hypothetical protein